MLRISLLRCFSEAKYYEQTHVQYTWSGNLQRSFFDLAFSGSCSDSSCDTTVSEAKLQRIEESIEDLYCMCRVKSTSVSVDCIAIMRLVEQKGSIFELQLSNFRV